MIHWVQQGPAYVGELTLTDGQPAKVAVVGPPENTRGAAMVFEDANGATSTVSLDSASHLLYPWHLIDIICMQERAFGKHGLPEPALDAT